MSEIPEACLYGAANLLLAEACTEVETAKDRKAKKVRVQEKKRQALAEAFPTHTAGLSLDGDAWKLLETAGPWEHERALRFLIDIAFVNPYSPYELKYDEKHVLHGLQQLGPRLGLSAPDVSRVWETRKSAIKAHRQVGLGKVLMFAAGGLVVLAVGGWLAAPAIAGWLGAGAGLAGAAATAHGLALLGGGSLAIGGWGMAGGMWLVVGVSGALGAGAAGGGALLVQLGAASARVELLKLQVSYKEIILAGQVDRAKAQEVLTRLEEHRAEVQKQLEEQQALNDETAHRIKDMAAMLRAIENSREWMRKQQA